MNPHNHLIPLDPPGRTDRRWRCEYCGQIGFLDDLVGPNQKFECAYVYPPCEYCGETPICASNCAGIAMALGSPNVAVVGGPKPKIGKA